MGVVLILIGIGFEVTSLFSGGVEFWKGASIWTVGGISLISGLMIFTKEEGFLSGN